MHHSSVKNELGDLAVGTHYTKLQELLKELGKWLTKHGRYEFRCRGRFVCHCLEGLQTHSLSEQLPQPEESHQGGHVCLEQAHTVDFATVCG